MCAGCGIPNCGDACGTNDWEEGKLWGGTVTCPKCSSDQDISVDATVVGRGSSGTLYCDWTCNFCKEKNVYEEDYDRDQDYDGYYDDYDDHEVSDYDIMRAENAYEARLDRE
jgi:hypothetical protein